MLRNFAALVIVCFGVQAAQADVVITKDRKGAFKITGIASKISNVEVTVDNVESLIDKSTGIVVLDGYTGVTIKKNERAKKGQTFPVDSVVKIIYKDEPDALLDGFDNMQVGSWSQAISAFREAYGNQELRSVFRLEAYFQIGICYASMGNLKRAIAHLAKWPASKSKYTPEVHRILAEIYTSQKKFKNARAQYAKISELAEISANWRHRASLGEVKVDIAERNYTEAERSAKRIASVVSQDRHLGDAHCLALALQAQAIWESKDEERLAEAEKLLRQATDIEGATDTNRALAYLTLGHVLYSQKNTDAARFSYLRVACLYPGERGYVASALQNAGQCFLDMSMHPDNAGKPIADDLFMKGMKLMAECGRGYRGTEAASKAANAYRQHKDRFEELKAKTAEDAGDGK